MPTPPPSSPTNPSSSDNLPTTQLQDITHRTYLSLKTTIDQLLHLHLSDELESPYVYEDLLKPINPYAWRNDKYGTDPQSKGLNELYDLIVILARRVAESLTRLSVLVKLVYHLVGALDLIIRRLVGLENGDRMLERRLGDLERRINSGGVDGIEKGDDRSDGEVGYVGVPPTPKSMSERFTMGREVVLGELEEEVKPYVRRSGRVTKVINYNTSSSDDGEEEFDLD
ncbi:hypothetical protein I302_104569 [Kwoniella bestiolae CBS 10118]|uniref:Uncharacterized protein n=1 Tax=Kwoniella bestiolae CBS 10118 TaxID=1296100 RepID=A0A1B9GBM9_9TREE|nr:hypothetical protein I302_03275 [Kwoniella bestiolae CBS 10118]OCF28416.1 hypothetical protein I302_03275 [Kwoniella bestiolae CBS 10118]